MKSFNEYEQKLYEWCIALCHLKAVTSWVYSKGERKSILACKAQEVISCDRAMQDAWFKEVEERLLNASQVK